MSHDIQALFYISQCTYWLYTVHLSLVAQHWHCCRKMLHHLLTHINSDLHKASCSASVAFRAATVNCLFFPSVSLCSAQLSVTVAAALWIFSLSTRLSHLSCLLRHIPPTNVSWFIKQMVSVHSDHSLSLSMCSDLWNRQFTAIAVLPRYLINL